MNDVLSLYVTLAILIASILGIVWFVWLERRPREFGRVRLIPTTPLLFICVLITMLMLARLAMFLGTQPHRPL